MFSRGIRGGDESDVDDWGARQASTKFCAKVRNLVARSFHLNKNAEFIFVPGSPESFKEERSPDRGSADRGLWYNWKQELVDSGSIVWKDDILNAQPDEGSLIEPHEVYLIAPEGKLFRDMTKEEIQENW